MIDMAWKPIETAPLDKRILLWWRPIGTNPYAQTVVCGQISSYEEGKWFNDRSEYQDVWHVIAWQPLPKAPNFTEIKIMPGEMKEFDCGDVPIHKAIPSNIANMLKAAQDAVAIFGKRNMDAIMFLEAVAGKEIGIHCQGDIEPYYTSWNDGECWIKKALSALKGEL